MAGDNPRTDSQAIVRDEETEVESTDEDDDEDYSPVLLVRDVSDIDAQMMLLEGNADASVNARQTPLFHAVRYTDDVSAAKALLDNGADVNARDAFKETVLHFAASAAMARLLIENGASVHALNRWGRTPLFRAVRYNRVGVVEELTSAGADVHVNDAFGQTAMFQISVAGDSVAALEVLVKHGASVQVSSGFRDTPLHRAAVYGNLRTVRFLADHGVPIDVSLEKNQTPLFEAASQGHLDIVKFLLDRGASAHGDPSHQYLPVVPAAVNGHLSVIAELLARGACFDSKQDDADVASSGARLSNIEVLERMIQHCKTVVPIPLDAAVLALDVWLSKFVTNLNQLPLAFRSLWMQVARKLERFLSRIKSEEDVSNHETRVMFGVIVLRYWKWTLEYSIRRASRPQDLDTISRLSPQDMLTICTIDREMDEFQLARMVLNGGDLMLEVEIGEDGNPQSPPQTPSDKMKALKASVVRWIPGVSGEDDAQPEKQAEPDRRVWVKLLKAALELTQLHKQQVVHGELVARSLQRIRSHDERQLRAAMKEPPRDPEAVRWKSPECLKGAGETFASDVFTFGMCILEAVSGQVPWGRVSSGVVSVLAGIGRLPKQPECMSDVQWQAPFEQGTVKPKSSSSSSSMEVVVLGSGPSSSVPSIRCLLTNADCAVCREAHANPQSKNRRLNPSVLVRNLATGENLLVDCGKTFREAALRVFPAIGVTSVHGVLLTHGHADACLGLDDLREVQSSDERIDLITKETQKIADKPLLLHCSSATREEIRGKFEYMIDNDERLPSVGVHARAPAPFRWVAKARFQLFELLTPFASCGFEILPFPVIHGAGYISNAFEFGKEIGVRFVYISDVSELTPEAKALLNDKARPQIDVLIIDALHVVRYHSTHMNLQDVLREIRTIRPKRTLLTGMSHELDYARDNAMLKKLGQEEGLVIEMAYDGLRLAFPNTTPSQ